jgi:serine/threonine-protein kinase
LGRYRLIDRLGRGCQGDVWRAIAEDPGADGEPVEVALKLLPPSLAHDHRRLAQFRREAERRARLAVPSVLPTSECGESDGIVFMAMPLVDGCSLGEIVSWRRRGEPAFHATPDPRHPLADAEGPAYVQGVVEVLARVARTLDHVHTSRVVHRDIKPANILLDRHRPDGVFLCDFGLGRDLDVATPEQLRDGAGTPLYMAPERLLRLAADEIRCDIYALGATLYEAVTLVPPLQIPDSLPWPSWTTYLATTRPAPPRSVRPGISEALEAIIVRAMAHGSADRYPTAACLAGDLESLLARVAEEGSATLFSPDPHPTATVAPGFAGVRSSPLAGLGATANSSGFAPDWEHLGLAETALSWLSTRLTRLCHPEVDAWKLPLAAE